MRAVAGAWRIPAMSRRACAVSAAWRGASRRTWPAAACERWSRHVAPSRPIVSALLARLGRLGRGLLLGGWLDGGGGLVGGGALGRALLGGGLLARRRALGLGGLGDVVGGGSRGLLGLRRGDGRDGRWAALARLGGRGHEVLLGLRGTLEGRLARHGVVDEQTAQLVEVGRDRLALAVEVLDLTGCRGALALGLVHRLGERLLGVLARFRDDAVGVAASVREQLLGLVLGVPAHLLGTLESLRDTRLGLRGVLLGVRDELLGLGARGLVPLGVGALGLLAATGDLDLGVGKRTAGLLAQRLGLRAGRRKQLTRLALGLRREALDLEAGALAPLVRLALGGLAQLVRLALRRPAQLVGLALGTLPQRGRVLLGLAAQLGDLGLGGRAQGSDLLLGLRARLGRLALSRRADEGRVLVRLGAQVLRLGRDALLERVRI